MGVLQLFGPFYDNASGSVPAAGDIYWVPTPDVEQNPRIFEAVRSDQRTHDAVNFSICQIQSHHFTNRSNRLPIKLLTLGATEELLIAKAKRRPAVVLYHCGVDDLSSLPREVQRIAKAIAARCFVVAPLYSVATPANPTSFMPELVARVRALYYPHLACLPELGSKKAEPGEIVRIDRLHVTYLQRGCQRASVRLHPEILTLLRDQLLWTTHGTVTEYLAEVIATVRESLPDTMPGM